MLMFILVSLGLCFIVQMANSLQHLLVTPLVAYAGVFSAIVGMLGVVSKKGSAQIWHDLFACGALLAWFAYWRPLFNDDAPIFFFFPLYFVFLGAFLEIGALSRRQRVDEATLGQMQAFAKNRMIQPWVLMLGVLVSLKLEQHYLLYPVMMTLLLLRFALFRYLDRG